MLTPLALAAIFLLLAALASATMLVQDVDAGRLRQRIRSVHARTTEQAPVVVAQRQLNRARLSLVRAQGQRLIDIVKLFAATAADWR